MKYHLNIQSIKKITAFQNEEVYSSWNQVFWFLWCPDQHCWIFNRKYYLHIFSPFSVLLSNLSITECIFNIIVTSFKSRQFLYQLHIWYCMFAPHPPFWHQFLHLMIQFDTSMFINTDRKTVKHTNTEKSWRGMSKDKFYMFSVSNRCRMGYRQIPVNCNLIQIHAQILNFNQFKFIMYRQKYLKHPSCIPAERAFLSTRKYSVKMEHQYCNVHCEYTPPLLHAITNIALLIPTNTRIVSNNVINMHILCISTKNAIILYQKGLIRFLPVSLMVGFLF